MCLGARTRPYKLKQAYCTQSDIKHQIPYSSAAFWHHLIAASRHTSQPGYSRYRLRLWTTACVCVCVCTQDVRIQAFTALPQPCIARVSCTHLSANEVRTPCTSMYVHHLACTHSFRKIACLRIQQVCRKASTQRRSCTPSSHHACRQRCGPFAGPTDQLLGS